MVAPKVSICMPVFNGGHYFKAALDSALAQTYENLEIVVVNDGSTDGGETERIALAYGDRVRYFHQPNRGVAGAMNTAVAHMKGDFFAWLSHDDLHLPHKTAAQIEFFGRIGRRHACLFSDYDLIGPDDKPIASVRMPAKQIRQNPRLPLYNGMINGCTLLIPVEILREFGPFDEALRCTQDYDVWNRILEQHEFFHQPEVLIRYRIHPGQGTNTPIATTEGNVLWKAMIASRNEIERAQMFGSTRHFFTSLATFLDATPYQEAAAYAHARAGDAGADALVSVVIPFHNQVAHTLRAVRSALDQTHRNVEVLLVDDGSTEDITAILALAETESRLQLLRQPNMGQAIARNRALNDAQGDYIAFLDSSDQFLPRKIDRQLAEMQRNGALFSHSSHYLATPGAAQGVQLRRLGHFGGSCYPEIIGANPVVSSTVMLHRSVVDAGFAFPTDPPLGEDRLAWIELALRYTLLGIDEPLSVIELSDDSVTLNAAKQVIALSGILDVLLRHRIHRRQSGELEKLRNEIRAVARDWIVAGRQIDTLKKPNNPMSSAVPGHPAFAPGGTGRVTSPWLRAA